MAFMLVNHLIFIDSFQLMSSIWDKLVSNLPKESLKYTTQEFQDDKLDLMAKKGVYDHLECFDTFNERELPTKDNLYSILNDEHISDDD